MSADLIYPRDFTYEYSAAHCIPSFFSVLVQSASSQSLEDTSLEILNSKRMHFRNPSLYMDKSRAVVNQLLWSEKLHLNTKLYS